MRKAKELTHNKPLTHLDLTRTLNWYNNNRTSNDARKYLHEYCKREIDSKLTISDISKWPYLATDGWVSRLLSNGVEFPIENIKGIGPKTLKLFEKLCGNRIIDLLLTIPRNFKRRKHLLKITNDHLKEEVAIEVIVEKHLPQFNPKMPYKILCTNNDVEIEIIFFRGYVKY